MTYYCIKTIYNCTNSIIIYLLFNYLFSTSAIAQREASIWYFGNNTGLDFTSGIPIPLNNSNMLSQYGSASICHKKTGKLFFYSNGEKVWNSLNQVMLNGDSLKGTNYVTQAALVIPSPSDSNQYYLFTLFNYEKAQVSHNPGYPSDLYYSIIDMRLDQGKGGILNQQKNIFLRANLTEKLTAVLHTNQKDYWILTHKWKSNSFYADLLNNQGFNYLNPIQIGSYHPYNPQDTVELSTQSMGFLQASPDGKKLACTIWGSYTPFSLFDFDAATGSISNYINLGNLIDPFGVSFSPDNTKLYVQNFSRTPDTKSHNLISQYDLKAGDTNAIISSGKSIYLDNPYTNIGINPASIYYALQIGPDGRIYGASAYTEENVPGDNNFYVINQPNQKGFDCDLQYQQMEYNGGSITGGLPNFVQNIFNGLEPKPNTPINCQINDVIVFPNPTKDVFQINVSDKCFQPYILLITNSLGQIIEKKLVTTGIV